MHDRATHHLLQQLPLTVSPFIQLPTAVTLPYSYQTLPLGLPPSSTAPTPGQTGYIVSASGAKSTTPEAIVQSCHALIQHLQTQRDIADQAIKKWESSIVERELMEKRRVAPGYLDTSLRILEPTRKPDLASSELRSSVGPGKGEGTETEQENELDRVFGK